MKHSTVIAKYLIDKAKSDGNYFTQMKILKMVYLANSAMLCNQNESLISDRIEAWQYGPVIPELYSAIRHYGRNPVIDIESSDIDENKELSQDEKKRVDDVYDKLKIYSAYKLSTYAHQKNSPWYKVYSEKGDKAVIDTKTIISCCKELKKIV